VIEEHLACTGSAGPRGEVIDFHLRARRSILPSGLQVRAPDGGPDDVDCNGECHVGGR
jgi:hypothetical protein